MGPLPQFSSIGTSVQLLCVEDCNVLHEFGGDFIFIYIITHCSSSLSIEGNAILLMIVFLPSLQIADLRTEEVAMENVA